LTYIDRVLLPLTRGRLGTAAGEPLLLLTTTGARSGRAHSVPLLYLTDGDDIVLIASKGGDPRHPYWYFNMKAQPQTSVRIRGATVNCLAHEAEGEARSKLWRRAVDYYPGYASYQARTEGRQIPVMILSPTTTKP
jgi:deazaflavin-dependent oxidoreductase (nitroreductase family)